MSLVHYSDLLRDCQKHPVLQPYLQPPLSLNFTFSVSEYTNPRTGSISYRVYGYINGKALRKNFKTRIEADDWAFTENEKLDAKKEAAVGAKRRSVYTVLSDEDVALVEALALRWAGRMALKDLLEVAERGASVSPVAKSVAKLVEEWLVLIEDSVGANWYRDLRARLRRFARDNPTMQTTDLTQPAIRAWLDGLDHAPVGKAHFRGALSRFFGWLIQKGMLTSNPCEGLKLEKKGRSIRQDDALPAILTPAHARALLQVYQRPENIRSLGWIVLTLFCGLRPEAEAARLKWSEIKLDTGEIQLYGRKKGASVRVFKATPQALAWLKHIKACAGEGLLVGPNSRRVMRRAVKQVNEALGRDAIKWDADICRHSFASYHAPSVQIHDLARMMGTSAEMLHRHYRHPIPSAQIVEFSKVLPVAKTVQD